MKKLTIHEFKDLIKKGYRIVDLRRPEDFSNSFIPGSLFINDDRDFLKNIRKFLLKDQGLVLICPKDNELRMIKKFSDAGFNNLAGFLDGGFETWLADKNNIDVIISISAEELLLDMKYGRVNIIDIRPKAEYDLKYIEESDNIPADTLINNYELIDNKSEICMICQNGILSMSLISYLKINGIHNIYHLDGGFRAIKNNPDFVLISSPTNN